MNKNDEFYMREALIEARKALEKDEVPIGAIVVVDSKIVGRGHNEREESHLISRHAEIVAIEDAEKRLNTKILDNATIYVTVEPCPMCAYAIMEAHIEKLVFGAIDEKRGAISVLDIFNKKLGSKVLYYGKIIEGECSNLLKEFFKNKR
jgi:tRNA(adenine34) deaminase